MWCWSSQTIKSSSRGEQTHTDGPLKCNWYPMEEGRGKACSRPQIKYNFTWNNTSLYWFTKLGEKNHYLKHSKSFSVQLNFLLQWHFRIQSTCKNSHNHVCLQDRTNLCNSVPLKDLKFKTWCSPKAHKSIQPKRKLEDFIKEEKAWKTQTDNYLVFVGMFSKRRKMKINKREKRWAKL